MQTFIASTKCRHSRPLYLNIVPRSFLTLLRISDIHLFELEVLVGTKLVIYA